MSYRKCAHCGKPIVWDYYWTTWDHTERKGTLHGELCYPESGFQLSTYATPADS